MTSITSKRSYPTFKEILAKHDLTAEENPLLFETRKSVLSILSKGFLFLLSSIIVAIVILKYPNLNLVGFIVKNWFVSVNWLAIIPLLFLLEVFRQYHDDLYLFNLKTMTCKSGRLSMNYSVPNIRYTDIRVIEVNQDIWGRLFNYGDVELDTAAQDVYEIYIEGVYAPKELASLIEELRQHSLRLALAEHGEASQEPLLGD